MVLETISVAVVGLDTLDFRVNGAVQHAEVDELLSAGRYDAVVLHQPALDAEASLWQLRRHSLYSHSPLYVTHEPEGVVRALSDGTVPKDGEQVMLAARSWRERMASTGTALDDLSLESRMLAWLWGMPSRRLHAVRAPGRAELYLYPVLEAFKGAMADEDPFWVLQWATQKQLIAPGTLHDRVRLCAHCGSGHLNYVDVCTECRSLSIERQPSLHCFVCGHVGSQDKFLKDRGLFCPNCLNQLRHIGSDYDRPMENYRCRDCQAFFVDAAVQARCLDCGQTHAPEQLRVREFHEYGLTEMGRMHCRAGLADIGADIDSHFQFQGVLVRPYFVAKLDWLLGIHKRYKRLVFSVVGVRLGNLSAALRRLGERRGHALLDALVERLVAILRDTDRCTRTADDIIWMLLPETDAAGAKRFIERLGALSQSFEGTDVDLDLRITSYSAPDDVRPDENAELLLSRLVSQIAA